MTTIDRCLQELSRVRGVATGVEVAYVARSRIGRLTLTLGRIIAKHTGSTLPDRPGPIQIPTGASGMSKRLAVCCNRLIDITKTLSQPSEPLDDRWRSGWSALLKELEKLEAELKKMKNES